MTKLVLANASYAQHMTDEGEQLQRGLEHAGWVLAGHGYPVGSRDVRELLEQVKPDIVFVQDVRDWEVDSPGCYDRRVSFRHVEALATSGIPVVTVCKDAGSVVEYQAAFAEKIRPSAIVTYYHDASVLPLSPWLDRYRRVRIHHTVDAELTLKMLFESDLTPRKPAVVSGAVSAVYPLRYRITRSAAQVGVEVLRHPGYGMMGGRVREYLRALAGYKVHVATASRYGFALRKIIESVAMGCTPVTDLPAYDVLPEIDGALVRISPKMLLSEIREAVTEAVRAWDVSERAVWAAKARAYYDWRDAGLRLDRELSELIVPAVTP